MEKLKSKTVLFLVISLFTTTFSCNRPNCKNENPIFANYTPDSKEYKSELIKQIKSADLTKCTFWFKEYVKTGHEELLYFDILGENLCAVLVLKVDDWSKLEELRAKQGVTFRGAEFKNLTFEIQEDSSNVKFVYRNFDEIID